MRVGLTGAAGFVGFHLAELLLSRGHNIEWAVDNLRPSYGGELSEYRATLLKGRNVPVQILDIRDETALRALPPVDVLVHLAAFPGVRAGEAREEDCFSTNVLGFHNILSLTKRLRPGALLYASSSSVYGDLGLRGPTPESAATGIGVKSHYATTKWVNEILAKDFTRRCGIPAVAMRFFTVYGPLGRPDMAYFKFAHAIENRKPLTIYGKDGGKRSYTFVTDAVSRICALAESAVSRGLDASPAALNISTGGSAATLDVVASLGRALAMEPKLEFHPRPSVDAEATWADTEVADLLLGDCGHTELGSGISAFVEWFREIGRNFAIH